MCGIFGYVERGASGTSLSLDVAIQALRHRGPNDSGQFLRRYATVECGLAHTRLSILDLSPAGHQPMEAGEGRFTLVYNGEIYNAGLVRRELETLGERFTSHCDTEVLIKAYARWGTDCLHKLNGMFAFAIWDAVEQKIFLARDRLGVKPLYYVLLGDRIVFASEVRALLETGAAPRLLSVQGLRGYLAFGSVQDPDTIIDGVKSLPAGTTLTFGADGCRLATYWRLSDHPVSALSEVEAVARTRELLDESVRSRLTADVPLGIFLSGGIDSAVIAALASQASTEPVHTFTLSFNEKAWDERDAARFAATRFGCEHHDVLLSSAGALRQMDAAMSSLDQPSADGPNSYFVTKAARESGLVVALSGIGADELFAGYHYFRAFKYLWYAKRLFGDIAVTLPRGYARGSTRVRKLLLLSSARGGGDAYSVLRAMFDPDDVSRFVHPDLDTERVQNPASSHVWGDDPVAAWSSLELTGYLRNTLLRDTDAMSMAHGFEVREPFLDYRLVQHVISLPARYKLKPLVKKAHLVQAVPELPGAIVNRRKMGFTLPLDVWLRGAMRPWAEERLMDGRAQRGGSVRHDTVTQAWRGFLSGRSDISASRIWALVALLDWTHRHNVSA